MFDAGRRSFRHDLDTTYKANRPEAPDDLVQQFPLVREVAEALRVPVLEEPGFEADDVIATLACRAREAGWEVVIVTGDKDFAQLVGERVTLYDPMAEASGRGGWTGPAEVEKKMGVPPAQVVEYQAILGDKIDNVPGIPGVGEVTAAALVRRFGTVEEMLRRPDEIPAAVTRGGEKLAEKIVGNQERLRLNRKLVELRCDMVLPYEPVSFERRRDRRRADAGALRRARVLPPAARTCPPPPRTGERRDDHQVLDAGGARGGGRGDPRRGRGGAARRLRRRRRPARIRCLGVAFAGGRARLLPARSPTATWARRRSCRSTWRPRGARGRSSRIRRVAKHGHDLKAEDPRAARRSG